MSSKHLKENFSSYCRSCRINYSLVGDTGKHKLIDAGMFCPMCKFNGKSIHHINDQGLTGHSLECYGCNNYIMYFEGDLIVKDELYFDHSFCLIRDLEDEVSCLLSNDEVVIMVMPGLLDASDPAKLFRKLKTYIVFS